MNRNIKNIYKKYNPYRIEKINSSYIFYCNNQVFVIKDNIRKDYEKLYDYLYSRNFKYLVDYKKDEDNDLLLFDYQNDSTKSNDQKALDLVKIVSLLHTKTSYYKDVLVDKYKKIYDDLNNNIVFLLNKYSNLFDVLIIKEFYNPSEYLFLRNYSLINNACLYSLAKLEEWYGMVSGKLSQRVTLNHNNLRLEHFIKNKNSYLISWDEYDFDSPVIDLYKFYLNEWENVSFVEILNAYKKEFPLLKDEEILLEILISIPFDVELVDNEMNNCINIRRLINYLNKSSYLLIGPEKTK